MGNKEKNFVSAVIYVHNGEDKIEEFLKTVIEVFENNFDNSEIICVNDSSTDNSLNVIRIASQLASSTSISVVTMSYFHGLEAAMNAGVDLSIGDFVFEFDNIVLDFGREEIMKVYHRTLAGYDIVSAVPECRERFSSRLFYRAFDRFAGFSYKMHTERFRILSRRVINRIHSMNKTILYRKVIYASQGLKTDFITYKPCKKIEKQNEREKMYRFRLAVDSLILFTEVGYRFSILMTAFMMATSAFMIAYTIIIFTTKMPVAGWTTTILFLSVAFFGLFGILTIIIKYMQLLINLTFKRKHYTFGEIEKLTK